MVKKKQLDNKNRTDASSTPNINAKIKINLTNITTSSEESDNNNDMSRNSLSKMQRNSAINKKRLHQNENTMTLIITKLKEEKYAYMENNKLLALDNERHKELLNIKDVEIRELRNELMSLREEKIKIENEFREIQNSYRFKWNQHQQNEDINEQHAQLLYEHLDMKTIFEMCKIVNGLSALFNLCPELSTIQRIISPVLSFSRSSIQPTPVRPSLNHTHTTAHQNDSTRVSTLSPVNLENLSTGCLERMHQIADSNYIKLQQQQQQQQMIQHGEDLMPEFETSHELNENEKMDDVYDFDKDDLNQQEIELNALMMDAASGGGGNDIMMANHIQSEICQLTAIAEENEEESANNEKLEQTVVNEDALVEEVEEEEAAMENEKSDLEIKSNNDWILNGKKTLITYEHVKQVNVTNNANHTQKVIEQEICIYNESLMSSKKSSSKRLSKKTDEMVNTESVVAVDEDGNSEKLNPGVQKRAKSIKKSMDKRRSHVFSPIEKTSNVDDDLLNEKSVDEAPKIQPIEVEIESNLKEDDNEMSKIKENDKKTESVNVVETKSVNETQNCDKSEDDDDKSITDEEKDDDDSETEESKDDLKVKNNIKKQKQTNSKIQKHLKKKRGKPQTKSKVLSILMTRKKQLKEKRKSASKTPSRETKIESKVSKESENLEVNKLADENVMSNEIAEDANNTVNENDDNNNKTIDFSIENGNTSLTATPALPVFTTSIRDASINEITAASTNASTNTALSNVTNKQPIANSTNSAVSFASPVTKVLKIMVRKLDNAEEQKYMSPKLLKRAIIPVNEENVTNTNNTSGNSDSNDTGVLNIKEENISISSNYYKKRISNENKFEMSNATDATDEKYV